MRSKIGALGGALVLALSLLGTTTAFGHEATYPSSITINRGDGTFFGKVSSPRKECKNRRNVSIYRSNPGPDTFIASGVTDADGNYNIRTGNPGAGTYYARVGRGFKGGYSHSHRCNPARSRGIRLNAQGDQVLGGGTGKEPKPPPPPPPGGGGGGNGTGQEDPIEVQGGQEGAGNALTGADVMPFVATAAGLIVIGLLLLLARRRRTEVTDPNA